MANQMHTTFSLLTFLSFLILSLTVEATFSPIDHYLINCGSTNPTTVHVDLRRFTGDSSESNSHILSTTRTIPVVDSNPNPNSSPIYHTARVFTRPSNYIFRIKDKGTHLVRIHFNRFNFVGFDSCHAQFHVSVNGYVLLYDFTVGKLQNPRIKDFVIWVYEDELVVRFIPSKKSNFAIVSAIEVISAPKDLVADVAQFVSSEKNERINGLMKNALETVYRVNVGGPKVIPFNDSLWRTWVPDDEFLKLSDGSKRGDSIVHFGGWINYRLGGASREVGPDNVYGSARVISSSSEVIPGMNITWVFPVMEGFKYLVRTHFCDIASIALGMLYFNVYVNGNLAYENLDLSSITMYELASPFYADFVVDAESSGVLTVAVGPSNMSMPHAIDAMLNGVEIMKMNNSMGSLDGEVSVELISKNWPRGNTGVFIPLIAAVCLLLTAAWVMQRKTNWVKDSIAWSRLPADVSEVDIKGGKYMPSSQL